MKKPPCMHALVASVLLAATFFFTAQQPANAQYLNSNNKIYGRVQQDLNSGLLSPWPAGSLVIHGNSFIKHGARLLRNACGVLIGNRPAAKEDQANLVNDIHNNNGNGIVGIGLDGLLGNLFGINSTVPNYIYGTDDEGLYNNGINPYGYGYNTSYRYNAMSASSGRMW